MATTGDSTLAIDISSRVRGARLVPEWWFLFVGGAICAVVGRRVTACWPRRRLYSNTGGFSVIPPGARPLPGNEECTQAGHYQLGWTEHIARSWRGGSWSQIIEATCRDCGRPQTQVRVVYPPDRTISVHPPQPREPRWARWRRRSNHGDGVARLSVVAEDQR